MTDLAELLADCDTHGIRLVATSDGVLAIDAPQDALTPNLIDRLKTYKGELLRLLRPVPDVAPVSPMALNDAPTTPAKPICRCGSTTWRDVSIHHGQSVRRDCGRCGRFIDFPVWYSNAALHNEQ